VRALAATTVLALAACTAPPRVVATPTATPQRGVLTVAALLDLSGPRAQLGTAQRDALQLWLDQQHATFSVKLRTVDVAGSDAKLLLDLHAAVVDASVDAVIVGAPVALDDAFARAIEAAALPILFTLPLPTDPWSTRGGRWAFALAPTARRLASREIDDALARGTLSPSLVLTEEPPLVDPMAGELEAELARRKLDAITRVPLPADGSVPPVVRSSLSVLRSVHCTLLAPACAPVAQAAQAERSPTFFYLSYLTAPKDLADHKELAARAIWPATRALLAADGAAMGPAEERRAAFLRAFAARYGTPSAHAATAYDALSLLETAAERSSPDDRGALRDALEEITMPLIATTYAFGVDRHAGADGEDLTYVRWTGSRIAAAPAPSLGIGIATPTPSPSTSAGARGPGPTATAGP
jgi:branched-chain amino acid transport system substrate-binding protein